MRSQLAPAHVLAICHSRVVGNGWTADHPRRRPTVIVAWASTTTEGTRERIDGRQPELLHALKALRSRVDFGELNKMRESSLAHSMTWWRL